MKPGKRSPAASVLKNRLVAIRTSESVVYEAPKKIAQSKGKIFHVCGEMRLPKLSRKSVKTELNSFPSQAAPDAAFVLDMLEQSIFAVRLHM